MTATVDLAVDAALLSAVRCVDTVTVPLLFPVLSATLTATAVDIATNADLSRIIRESVCKHSKSPTVAPLPLGAACVAPTGGVPKEKPAATSAVNYKCVWLQN